MRVAGVLLIGGVLTMLMPNVLWAQQVSADEQMNDAAVNMSPNPFREQITLRLPESKQRYKVQVYNNAGQLIYTDKLEGGANTIVTQNWAPGHYIIKVNDLVAQKMILLDQ